MGMVPTGSQNHVIRPIPVEQGGVAPLGTGHPRMIQRNIDGGRQHQLLSNIRRHVFARVRDVRPRNGAATTASDASPHFTPPGMGTAASGVVIWTLR